MEKEEDDSIQRLTNLFELIMSVAEASNIDPEKLAEIDSTKNRTYSRRFLDSLTEKVINKK